ncbi:MAG: RHS repeat-associated core domain-containing protein [Armatimonadota bacterium]
MVNDKPTPYSAVRSDGNLTTQLPIVAWEGRGLDIGLVLYHNRHDVPIYGGVFGTAPYPLGYGWTHTYNVSITTGSGTATVREGDGRKHVFTQNVNGTYSRPAGVFETLVLNGNGTWTLTRHNQVKCHFTSGGALSSIEDLNGNTITLTYSSGKLTTVTDPTGRTLTFSYTGNVITSITDPLSRSWNLSYAGSPSHLYRVTDPGTSGYYVEFGYDSVKAVTSVKDRRGYSWSFAYDGSGRLTTVTDPLAEQRIYAYPYNNQLDVTDEAGNVTAYFIQGDGEMTGTRQQPTYGGSYTNVSYTYDSDHNRESMTKPSGDIWEWTYDGNGNVLTEEDPITRTLPGVTKWTYTYNSLNRRTSATDALGNVTTWSFDVDGNCTGKTDALNNDWVYTVDTYGQRTHVTDPLLKIWETGYNANGHVLTEEDPLTNTTTFEVNGLGWVTKITDPTGLRTRFTHDDLGRVKKLIHVLANGTDGPDREHTYDAEGNLTQLEDENGKTVATAYNALRWVTSVTDANLKQTTFGYNDVGKRTSLTNARNKTTTWTLDGMYRVTGVTYPDSTTEGWTYTANSQIAAHTDGRNNTVYRSYDDCDRLTGIDYPTGTDTTISYLDNDLRDSLVDRTGTYTWTYDDNGAVTEVDGPQGTLEYLYDAAGMRSNLTRTGLGSTSYGYDNARRLTSIQNRFSETTSFTLDAAGRTTQQDHANGTKVVLTYNADRGWLDAIEHRQSNNTVLARYEYTRGNAGEITGSVQVNDHSVAYTYDDAYQLTGETRTGTSPYTITYAYDDTGNRTSKTVGGVTESYTYGDNNQLLTAGSKSYGYDNAGNLTSVIQGGQTTTLAWDYNQKLTGITYPNSTTNSFVTNDLGKRVSKTDSAGTTTYVFDGNDVVADSRADYTRGGVTGLVSEREGSTSRTYHGDQLGSTRGLTNSSQSVTHSREYDAFGMTVAGTGLPTPFGFVGGQGYQKDPDSGLMLLGARYYDPSVGRFISRDPIGYSGGLNLYAYSSNNPVNATDPRGTHPGAAVLAPGAGAVAYMTMAAPLVVSGPGGWVLLGILAVVVVVGVGWAISQSNSGEDEIVGNPPVDTVDDSQTDLDRWQDAKERRERHKDDGRKDRKKRKEYDEDIEDWKYNDGGKGIGRPPKKPKMIHKQSDARNY